MNRDIWNDDGTPKFPGPRDRSGEALPFADLADDEAVDYPPGETLLVEGTPWANRLRQQVKANTPASVGDIVHYWDGDACVAAIVTGVPDFEDDCALSVFYAGVNSAQSHEGVEHDEGKGMTTWHWPESL